MQQCCAVLRLETTEQKSYVYVCARVPYLRAQLLAWFANIGGSRSEPGRVGSVQAHTARGGTRTGNFVAL